MTATGAGAVLVLQHEDTCPPAWLGEWLEAAGLRVDVLAAHRGDAVPDRLTGHDALVVLGGEMGANDDDRYPWLAATKRLIRQVAADRAPFLGICLGHQLAAVALGGEVARNTHGQARGLTPVQLTSDGRADPLLAGSDGLASIQWNGDVVTRLPDGATLLAAAPDGTVQAARFGPRAWGVQFHPEASPAVFRSWTVDRAQARPARPEAIARVLATVEAIDAAEASLRASWVGFVERFARLVAES